MENDETCPLPEDPTLAAVAAALNEAGHWVEILDRDWRCAYMTDAWRLTLGGMLELAPVPIGAFYFGPEHLSVFLEGRGGFPLEFVRELFEPLGPWMLAELPGGRDELRERADPRLRDVVEDLEPVERMPALHLAPAGITRAAGRRWTRRRPSYLSATVSGSSPGP